MNAENWGNAVFYLLIGMVLFAAPHFIELSVSLVTGYILAILYMITPLSELMHALPTLGRASVALNKIRALEGEMQGTSETLETFAPTQVRGLVCRDHS